MDLSSLTLPSLSQSGQKNTDKEAIKPEVKNYLISDSEVYQRAGLVLWCFIDLTDIIDIEESIKASKNTSTRLAVPQSIIDIETALAEEYAVVMTIKLYEKFEAYIELHAPDTSKEIIDIVQIVVVGYDRETQMFIARNQDDQQFTIAYDYVINKLVAFDLWAIAH